MDFDRAELQVFANYCVAAAESMAFTLARTAHSTFVKETEDFSCTIMTPDGQTFASPRTLGATWYAGLDYGPLLQLVGPYEPGDVWFTNDAYSGYVATHTPDVVMWKPVFLEGQLICFVGGHIHNTDMGGAVPASLSRTLTEVHQEGIRFPPMRIVRSGVVEESLLSLMATNVRAPEQNQGDMKAQLASLATGERKILEVAKRFGLQRFRDGVEALLRYSEQQARTVARTIPDGEYFFADYADEDAAIDGKPMRVALTLRVRDGELELDFTGSDPQLSSSLNVPTGGRERHVLPLVGLNYVLYSLNPDLLLNAGMLRIARCILPEGSVLNPQPPAAVGMRSLTCMVLQVVVLGAFSRAAPHRLPACPSSGMSILNVKTMDRDGRTVMASIGPIGGGAGGGPSADGSDGSGANSAFLRNTPVEINEAEVPIRIRRYGLVPSSGGAGKYRGGLGTVMEFQVFSPNTLVTARNRDRSHFSAWGVLGGLAGRTSTFIRNPGLPSEENLGNIDLVNCRPGDIIRCEGGGGGGYEDPFERVPAKVLEDVRRGYVTVADARELYGVTISNGLLDEVETSCIRRERAERTALEHFSYGAVRVAHERKWTEARYMALTRRLAELPVSWRFFLKHQAFDALDASLAVGEAPDGPEVVDDIFDALILQYPELSPERQLRPE
ncbi:hydantoin utilization protein B [Bradyrhizobium sp. CCBAU 45394]|uniref:hydantoinase B/oxoprolinase family protein n=1 Tax=Bradyrhizobium sp. CCBAU 45394 TaxID=1325087 RepID=UPI002304AE05|nr:hydantoinase B/oxoprolinase family protein [Bradyrhizobium sp. CCBAU 45394]MDA9391393.1 hydantoin utilization protein B [Bradyrhizobium sp. CCBAU 45394]